MIESLGEENLVIISHPQIEPFQKLDL